MDLIKTLYQRVVYEQVPVAAEFHNTSDPKYNLVNRATHVILTKEHNCFLAWEKVVTPQYQNDEEPVETIRILKFFSLSSREDAFEYVVELNRLRSEDGIN